MPPACRGKVGYAVPGGHTMTDILVSAGRGGEARKGVGSMWSLMRMVRRIVPVLVVVLTMGTGVAAQHE